jgi:hypothetical protein
VRFLLLPPRSPPVPVSVTLFVKGVLRGVPSLSGSDGGAGLGRECGAGVDVGAAGNAASLCVRRKTSDEGEFLGDSCDNTAG